MNKLGIYTILFIFLSLPACKKSTVTSHEQEMLFQLEYVNYSWGYQHNGFIIDGEGNVLEYDNPQNWNFPDNNFILTQAQVAENLGMCRKTSMKIPSEELHKYAGFIKNISSSKVTAPKNAGADEGSTEFICYQLMSGSSSYKGYIIKMEGDYTCENLNFYSKKVASWMKEINSTLKNN
jgi:hypothetical protein